MKSLIIISICTIALFAAVGCRGEQAPGDPSTAGGKTQAAPDAAQMKDALTGKIEGKKK